MEEYFSVSQLKKNIAPETNKYNFPSIK